MVVVFVVVFRMGLGRYLICWSACFFALGCILFDGSIRFFPDRRTDYLSALRYRNQNKGIHTLDWEIAADEVRAPAQTGLRSPRGEAPIDPNGTCARLLESAGH
jgi:hypothetical protein